MASVDDIDASATAVADLDETCPHGSESLVPVPSGAPARLDAGDGLASKLGRYVLLREIGAGAIGVVYAAYHEGLDRKLAIKVLNRQRAGRADLEARLRREAKALAKLSHPNVVQVYDVGEFDGRVFVAMEFVEGQTLTQWLRGDHDLAEKLAMFVAAGRGLAAAHQAGVIHRDFKPDNVLVGHDGRPRVLDFGLARATERLPEPSPAEPSKRPRSGPLIASLAQLLHTGPSSTPPNKSANRATERPPLRPVPDDAGPELNPPTCDPAQRSIAIDLSSTLATADDLREVDTQLDHDPELAATELSGIGPRTSLANDDVVTRDGALLGTPAYMSPEQFLGQRVDQASDQFSFCVALYDALYGHRPFAGKNTMELAVLTQEGRVVDPPPNSEVPARLRQIILRGLSPKPDERYPSIDELLAELEHDPGERRRSRLLTGIAVVAVATLAFVVGALGPKREATCPELAEVEAELWTEATAAQLEDAFTRSQLGYASAAWASTEPRLAAWSRAWAEQRVDACTQTHVRREYSEEVLDLRQACLARGRKAFDALVQQFRSGDPGVIERAVEAAAALPDPDRCSDIDSLLTRLEPPPESVAEVTRLREQLAEIETLANTGRWQQGLALAAEAVDQARETKHGPIVAEALFVHGRLFAESGAGADAFAALQAALEQAERHGHDELVPQVAIALASLSIYTRPDPIAGRIWARRSLAALDRIDEQGHLRARGIWALGSIERLDGENAQAEAHIREALALLDANAPDHPDRAIMINELGTALEARGQIDAAREVYEQAVARASESFGPEHPRVGHAHYNLSRLAVAEGRLDDARTHADQARRIYANAHGPDHRDVGSVELLAANIALVDGDLDQAEIHARRVKDIYDAALAPDNVDRAEPDFILGHIAFARRDLDTALFHYRNCLATQRASLPPGHIAMAATLTNLGLVHFSLAEYDPATDKLGEALALLERGEQIDPEEIRMGRQYLGDALLERAGTGDLRRAAAQFEAAFEGCTDTRVCAELALRLARAHSGQGDAKAARHWAEVARPLYLSLDEDPQADSTTVLAELASLAR